MFSWNDALMLRTPVLFPDLTVIILRSKSNHIKGARGHLTLTWYTNLFLSLLVNFGIVMGWGCSQMKVPNLQKLGVLVRKLQLKATDLSKTECFFYKFGILMDVIWGPK